MNKILPKNIVLRFILILLISFILSSCGVKGDIELDQEPSLNKPTIFDKLI
ncbi:MAG: lipoprotein [Hyphomicrobiales bacterium]|nr:lipoprotein [Hyphomicrobiales bacterium]